MADDGAKTGMRPLWRGVLIVSLAVNLAVVGAVVGAFWRHGDERGARGVGHAGAFIAALDHSDKRAIGRSMRAKAKETEGFDREAWRGSVLAALRSVPFDRAAVLAAIEAQEAAGRVRMQASVGLFLDRIAAMDDAQRAQYAQRLEEILARPRGKGKYRD